MLANFAISLDSTKFIELFFDFFDILEQIWGENSRHFFDQVLMNGFFLVRQSPDVDHRGRQIVEEQLTSLKRNLLRLSFRLLLSFDLCGLVGEDFA